MRSIWIAVGRDPNFGVGATIEHLFMFESSFDAYSFVNRIQDYDHLPEEARAVVWNVTEHPLNQSKVRPLMEFSAVFTDEEEDIDD